MSTQAYYKDRLGFDPNDAIYDGGGAHVEKCRKVDENADNLYGYEENLCKFKDERDTVQKKTFTKWVNKHLKKANLHIRDLFEDLRDGHNLITLLEVLTGEALPREKGRMRFHMLHNIDTALNFLFYKKIKLVNIRSEDIVDGNPKLTLGLIWTIILHFQISDIVLGQETNVSARDYLLHWARRTTQKYPGVNISDFTKSWRDGLAFSAIVHRNRPDLLDWRQVKSQLARERMATAFHLAEREYGVTRLLDPEDVDTHEPDEKSLITYISSLHEVFPEPPSIHPLYDVGAQQQVHEYRDLASSLHLWMREKQSLMQDVSFPPTLMEMKKIAMESARFRTDELPPRQRDKTYLTQLFRDLHKYYSSIGETDVIEPELHIDSVEHSWQHLMVVYQKRDRHVLDELKRLEMLQRLAEKVHAEIKQTDAALDTVETTIEFESKRIERVHPLEAKKIADQIEQDLASIECNIQSIKHDVNVLKEHHYPQANELDKRVNRLHERWVHLRHLLHNRIVGPLANLSFPIEERTVTKHIRTVQETRNVETNPHFRSLMEHIEWCKNKLKQLKKAEYGTDLPSVQAEREFHQREHKQIDQYHSKVECCVKACQYFSGEELNLYNQHLGQLQKIYADLLSFSTNRMTDLETLLDFIQSATKELEWLNEKEEVEVGRDWSDTKMDVQSIEAHYEHLMSDLERREIQFTGVQERGECLVFQNHPAAKVIEAHMAAMQAQWAWLLQLTHCLETHLANTRAYQQFMQDIAAAEDWIKSKDDIMNNDFSQGDFTLDVGERLLQGMRHLKDELNSFGDRMQELTVRAHQIVPLKKRRQPVTKPITVTAVCNYKQHNFVIEKGKECTLTDNSGRIKWRVHNASGIEAQVPGVSFVLPPPDKDCLDAAERLRRQYERSLALWQKKQLRMRQNMIFATIKVVKGWDLPQFIAIGKEERKAIRRALNEDADKLMAEGDPSDPQLRRLRREIDEVNRLFDELERRAKAEEDSRKLARLFSEQCSSLYQTLEDAERMIIKRVLAWLPRDIDTLQHLVLEHKEFEAHMQNLEPEVDQVKDTFRSITLKTPHQKKELEKVLQKWKNICDVSNLYNERLKCIEVVLDGMADASQVISEFESKLALFSELPNNENELQIVHDDLLRLQSAVGQQQICMDQLNDDVCDAKGMTEKSRLPQRGPHGDIERLEKDMDKLNKRWQNVCSHLTERLKGCEQQYTLLKNYKQDILSSVVERAPTIEDINANGEKLMREAKQAIEEKYRVCEASVSDLLQWLSDIEVRLASQDQLHEVDEELRNQINTMKQIHEDIVQRADDVSHCGDLIRQLVLTGGEFLSRSEMSALERDGRTLKVRYDKVADRCENLLRRLLTAKEDLTKLTGDMNAFSNWLAKARRLLEEKESNLSDLQRLDTTSTSTKEFVSDVIAHQADLRFLTMAVQKFVDEGKEYLSVLNEMRTSLPSRLPHIEPYSAQDSPVRCQMSLLTQQYRDLFHRANNLSDRLTGVGGRQKDYNDALEKARQWMRDAEPRALRVLNEPIGADAKAVEEQLHRTKALNNEFIANGRLIENAKNATDALLRSLDGQVSPSEMSRLEQPVNELEDKYNQLRNALAERCQELDTTLVQSQGVQDALDGITNWLNVAENQLKNLQRPASLIKERLEEQIREHCVFKSDIDTHLSSIDSMYLTANEFIASANNSRVARKIETKLNDTRARFEKLHDRAQKRGDFLDDVHRNLVEFLNNADTFEQWYTDIMHVVDAKVAADEQEFRIRELMVDVNSKRGLFESIVNKGKELLNMNDVTDTSNVRDRVRTIEKQWKELNSLLEEKQNLSKWRTEQQHAYDNLRDKVKDWLTQMENKVSRFSDVAVDMEILKRQSDELKPILKEYKDYAITIEKVNEIGTTYDSSLSDGRPDSPSRRRSQMFGSSTKRGLTLRPSSSYDTKFDGKGIEDASGVQQQLSEINNRYTMLGMKLNDRQSEIESIREELKRYLDNLKVLSAFLEKIQRQLPREVLPNSKDDADKLNRQIRQLLEEMYEKQSILDSTRSQVKELLRRKSGVPGADGLNNAVEDVTTHWKNVIDHLKNRLQFIEDMRDFLDTHDALSSWLSAKDRMLTVLGPISSDSRMVQSQVQQVQVLREEFRTQQPQLQHFIELGDAILAYLDPHTPDGQKIAQKINAIQQRWKDLLNMLEQRADSLGAAADTSREFDAQLIRLRDALQAIADNLDELPHNMDAQEQLRKLENLERQLEGQRPLLADLEAAGHHLCDVLSDPASRADIQAKLNGIRRQYNALQKKLDNRKAELEGSLRDGRQFDTSLAKMLGWLSEEFGSLSERLLISAIRDVLEQQLANHDPIYRDVLAREHEVIMLLNKGRDMLGRSNRTDTKTLQRDLDKIQQQWDKLRKEAVDRQTRLQTCNEHCRKYYTALESFLPWLRQAEDKLDSIQPSSFQRKVIDSQLKELQTFRNEIWRKSGEYENVKSLADTFLAACDIDKDVVKAEINDLKERWDRLNDDLLQRTQLLEDQSRKMAGFYENLRDLQHNVERCEDKLVSHDALGGASRDPKLLEQMKALKEEVNKLKKPLQSLYQQANDLIGEVAQSGYDCSHILDDVDALSERISDLQSKLDDRCGHLQSMATAATQFNDQVKMLTQDLSNLENELDAMHPPGREIKIVKEQITEVVRFIQKVNKATDGVNETIRNGQQLVDSGFAPDTAHTRQQVEMLKKQLAKLDDRAHNRQHDLENTLKKLEEFALMYENAMRELQACAEQARRLQSIGSDVNSIKSQQHDFKKFMTKTIMPLGKDVEGCNRFGQGLIQSAAAGVDTSKLEKDLEKMNDLWNDLKDRLNERERRLDVALLHSGKFQEALDGLAKWLTDTEELVANQKPPSSDYKVVKAQLQEQKFLKKMLLDRQNSMSSLFAMGNELAKEADPAERKSIEKQLKNLMERFDALTDGAQQRTLLLEQAMKVAREFQDKLIPLQDWLDRSEKKVKGLALIPTDEEKIQQNIREHESLHAEILGKKPDFSELADIASNLMSLVSDDEATLLADKLQEVTDRYGDLVEASEQVGHLLNTSRQGLRHLVLTYQDLAAWMDDMEKKLHRFKVLAVHSDKLLEQMKELTAVTEEIQSRQQDVDGTVDTGVELMRHISSEEALQLKDKLDSLQRRYNDLITRGSKLLKDAEDMLPIVQQFHKNHCKLVDWMQNAELILQSAELHEDQIGRLESELHTMRSVLDTINLLGPQLCQTSPGEGAATIEGLVTRDNRRFDAISEQIQRRAERIHLSKQRALEVITDIDELMEWFREVEIQLNEAEKPSADPELIRLQLKEHKALNDDISSQKGRVRDILSTAKKVLRDMPPSEDNTLIREKMDDLRDIMEIVWRLSSDRLSTLEQALPLAKHFYETHSILINWLADIECQISMLSTPALRPDKIAQQQDRVEMLIQSVNEHKPLLDKLNKTGEALMHLCNADDAAKVQELIESDNARYQALKVELRDRQQALEEALQESAQFSDKLEGMLRALANTADQVNNQEPISAHPPRIRDQITDNDALMSDLDKRKQAYAAVQRAADDVINRAANKTDPAIADIKRKLDKLKRLWDDVQRTAKDRGHSLDDALVVAQKFWNELHAIMATLKDLEDSLICQEPPGVAPKAIQEQQVALQEIRHEIDQTKPSVDRVRVSGKELMHLCGEPDKPEVRKHIEDLDSAWDNVTALFAKREENLIDAMEKAMDFHDTMQSLLDFLTNAENKFNRMGALGTDIDTVKRQMLQLTQFKADVDPYMIKIEALNRQAQELTERTSSDQATAIKEPLLQINKRWDDLLRGIVERQRQLENALLRLGQFQHALSELLVWISRTNNSLDELKPIAGDPQILEIELAKLKVIVNDIQAHQTSVDTLNDAGRQIIEYDEAEAHITQDKLNTLNTEWKLLMQKAADRQHELEDALNEAQQFNGEIQDLLSWLGDVDGLIAASKPVGGLPETATEQLERFMEIYNEIEDTRPKIEAVLARGQEYLKRCGNAATNLQHNLKTLKQRWDTLTARANDKRIKLEIALKEATEFHEALQLFVDWLTNAEKVIQSLKPVSRVLGTIQEQIEEHKLFLKDVNSHREVMMNLDKKGTHLKYFSQKQDVILIKNLLISVQHRWERVASKSADRTRSLDSGYKEAKDFHDAWHYLTSWLDETEDTLNKLNADAITNDPDKIKQCLTKHQEVQRTLSAKQGNYDNVMKWGKQLKDKAPKTDEAILKQMLIDLKNKWTAICNKTVDRQRKLEEALLYSGQFKEAIAALLIWLRTVEKDLSEDGLVHGDLDTVNRLIEVHRHFEQELERRNTQMESIMQTGRELEKNSSATDATQIVRELDELSDLWSTVCQLTRTRSERLQAALREAEKLHKSVNMLLDWLSEAERKLRFVGSAAEDETQANEQMSALERFQSELREKETTKDETLNLAHCVLAKAHSDSVHVIKNWIKVIQTRWDEVSQWAHQRHQKLSTHLQSLRDLDDCLEELINWLLGLENTLTALKREELPMSIPATELLITDHNQFMDNTQKRQHEVDRICKVKQLKSTGIASHRETKRFSKLTKTTIRGSQHDINDSTSDIYGSLTRRQSRTSLNREFSPDPRLPHFGPRFPSSEPEFRSPRVKLLYDKWRHVWMLSWERQRELHDHLMYLKEKEKADNFSWDDWRKRFLKFMNNKKSRVTDVFRKIDKDNNELIPRDDFIEAIIRTKFDTSRPEMNLVADMFDLDNRGLIDWKKFIAALRPDWEEKVADTDAQKIHDEVKRLVMLCTCRQKFRVFQVGEGKYRFGESQKLRLVRILRSTVMVRVGGGWVALEEFLLKNDPCRAHEQLAELMPIFEQLRAKGEVGNVYPLHVGSTAGPTLHWAHVNTNSCHWIRERSARSTPMGRSTSTGRSSLSAGTPDSLSDNESTSFRTPRRPTAFRSTLTPGGSGANSRPASRAGSRCSSKPPSRHGSNLSLDSTDDIGGGSSRIPRRTPLSGTPSSARRPLNGSSSRPRTPTGFRSTTSPATRSTNKSRQVTIGQTPTLKTSSRTRTPSGSNTPVSFGQQSTASLLKNAKSTLANTSDGALSSSTRDLSKRKTTNGREPFRL